MEKLIIENRTDLPMIEVLDYVHDVVCEGKDCKGGYDYITNFAGGINVAAFKNKSSDRLVVYKEGEFR